MKEMGQKLLDNAFIILAILLVIFASAKLVAHYNSDSEQTTRTDVKVLVYSKTGCSYCRLAEELLEKNNIPYEVVELTNNKDLIIKLVKQTGQTTVPYVFVNDEFIGGYQNLHALNESGGL